MILTILPKTRLMVQSKRTRSGSATPLGEQTPPAMAQGLSRFELADRLVQIWVRNAARIEKLDALRERIASTRRYLASSRRRVALGESYLHRLLGKQEACFAAIRADRRLATTLVRELESRRRATPHRGLTG